MALIEPSEVDTKQIELFDSFRLQINYKGTANA